MLSEMMCVQQRFNQASQTYDAAASVQKSSAQKLSNMIHANCDTQSLQTILDLGCGTGFMTEALLPHCPSSVFTLVDFSPRMLQEVSKKFQSFSNIQYQCANFLTGQLDVHDLIVSNFAFQWAESLENVVLHYASKAKVLAFTALLAGTFKDWYAILREHEVAPPIKPYPTENALLACLTRLSDNYHTELEEKTILFSNSRALMSYLKALGANAGNAAISFSSLRKISQDARPVSLTYRIFYAVVNL